MKFAAYGSRAALIFFAAACTAPSGAEENATTSESGLSADAPIKLRFANARNTGCSSCVSWSGVVEVENLGYAKDVTVVYKSPGAGWQEAKARYLRSVAGNRELWSFEGVGGIGTSELAVRYRVGGREYWDSNGGGNYKGEIGSSSGDGIVGMASPMGSGIDVAVTSASASFPARGHVGSSLFADVLVRNLAYDKEVTLVYTTDGWKTVKTAAATYAYGGQAGGETWRAFTWFDTSATKIEYVVVAKQVGREAWDNDFGQNFECHAEAGAWKCSGAAFTR
jgi:hypothetical protein